MSFGFLWNECVFEFEPVGRAIGNPRADQRAAADRCAARVLARLGIAERSVARHHTGRPLWPAGVVGSIAHTATLAVVAGAPEGSLAALGVDVEVAGALDPADARYVLTPSEQRAVAAAASPRHVATALWCAKEAAFKAWCGWAGDALEGTDPLEVKVVRLGDEFVVTGAGYLAPLPPLAGRWARIQADLLMTVALVEAQSTASARMPSKTSAATASSPST